MRTFTDNAGRTWTVVVNVDTIKRVRGSLDVDLLEVVEGTLIERLIRDPILLCDVIYVVCKPEADEKHVSDEAFGRAMAGDAIEHASQALLEEIIGFFQNSRDREILKRLLGAVNRVMEKSRDLIDERLTDVQLDEVIKQALESAGNSSGTAPESSESTPDG